MRQAQQKTALALGLGAIVSLLAWAWSHDRPRVRTQDGDSEVWRLSRADILGVQVATPDGGMWSVERTGEDGVFSLGGGQIPVDPRYANELLDALVEAGQGIEIREGDLAGFGLDEPWRVSVLVDGERLTLDVGRVAPVGGRTYVRTASGQTVAVYGGIGEIVRQSPGNHIDTALTRVQPLDQVRVTSPDGVELTVSFEDGQWTSEAHTEHKALSDWVYAWRELHVARWIAMPQPEAMWSVVFIDVKGAVERRRISLQPECAWVSFTDGRSGCLPDEVVGLLEVAGRWSEEQG